MIIPLALGCIFGAAIIGLGLSVLDFWLIILGAMLFGFSAMMLLFGS